jgi:hypothetical protein
MKRLHPDSWTNEYETFAEIEANIPFDNFAELAEVEIVEDFDNESPIKGFGKDYYTDYD